MAGGRCRTSERIGPGTLVPELRPGRRGPEVHRPSERDEAHGRVRDQSRRWERANELARRGRREGRAGRAPARTELRSSGPLGARHRHERQRHLPRRVQAVSLQLRQTKPATVRATWGIQTPTIGVVIIDVVIDESETPLPLHWRVGTWVKPPLDLSIDHDGRLVGIQFVLQDERVQPGHSSGLPDPAVAVPVFNVENWPIDRYRDEAMVVDACRLSGGELLLRVGEARDLTRACRTSRELVVAFDQDDSLAEIRLGPLSREDWEVIDTFSFVT